MSTQANPDTIRRGMVDSVDRLHSQEHADLKLLALPAIRSDSRMRLLQRVGATRQALSITSAALKSGRAEH